MGLWNNVTGAFGRMFGYSTPHTDRSNADVDCSWDPRLRSTDGDIIGARPYVEARIKDLIQTDGFLSGALETHCSHAVGQGLTLSATPDWQALGMSEEQGEAFAATLESEFKTYIKSSRNWVDAGRRHNWSKLQVQAYKSFLVTGEILAVPKFRQNTKFGTSLMLLDPNRLYTPMQRANISDESEVRAGVRIGPNGEALSYFIHDRNPLEAALRPRRKAKEFTEVAAYGRTGRKRVVHHFDPVGPEQTRGISLFAPVIDAVKRQHDLSDATLKAAIYQTLIAAVIKSELDYEQAMGVLGGKAGAGGNMMTGMKQYISDHLDYYENMNIKLDGLKAIHLLPNEDLELKSSGSINAEYAEFAKSMNRESARGVGLNLESYTGDYSQLSFSGGMLSGGEQERGHIGRRDRILAPFCQDVYELFIEELLIRKPELLPADVDFYSMRDEICRANWIGPPPLMADPEKMARAAETRLENRITTRQYEAAQIGMDWREMMRQQAREQEYADTLGIRDPKLEQAQIAAESKAKDAMDSEAGNRADSAS